MRARRLALLLCLAIVAAGASAGTASAASTVSTPSKHLRSFAGQTERFTVNGTWLRRLDPTDVGRSRHWERMTSGAGWSRTRIPDVWNAGDNSIGSMNGGVAWYRKSFRLPREPAGGRWIVRFEDVHVQADVFLNGKAIGHHRGAYAPFELTLPANALKTTKVNRLVVRTDNRRTAADFPPASTQADGTPGGGWWNDGGIPREVTLRRASEIDLSPVQITPDLRCPRCSGRVEVRATATNVGPHTRTADVAVTVAGRSKRLGRVRIPKNGKREVRGTISIPRPRIWSPKHPHLYTVTVDARVKRARVAVYRARTGIRSVRVKNGQLELNFSRTNLRGFGFEEQARSTGSALTDAQQDAIFAQARSVGGLVLRAHYPLDPRMLEQADRRGFLIWNEIPVFQSQPSVLGQARVRDAAVALLAATVQNLAYHPSVFTWSVGNELRASAPPSIQRYFQAAKTAVDALDRTRPLSYAHTAAITQVCKADYSMFDLIGINDYFGWYGHAPTPLSNPGNLPLYLDKERACAPQQAVMITETGAEATHDGPATERGTYAFQNAYAAYHFAVYRTRPWLSGALYWALREFRVRPGWTGANPAPDPPYHRKGPLRFDGSVTPLWRVLRAEFRGVDQLAPAPTGPVTVPPSPPGPVATPPDAGEAGGDAGDADSTARSAARAVARARAAGRGGAVELPYWLRDQESGTDG